MGCVKTSDLPIFKRRLEEVEQPILENPRDDESGSEVSGGVDNALAQFVEMLHQAHAREIRAFGNGRSRLADCFGGINHDGSEPPRGRLRG